MRDYIEDGILTSDMLSVEIKNNDETVVKRNVADAEYDSYTKELTLELEDTLASWGRRQYPGRGLTEETSAFALLTEVFSGLGYTESDVEKMCVNTIVVGTEGDEMTVAEFLKAIMIPYPYLEPDTYRATIEKFCRLAMLCCYADDNNFPVFVSGRPVMTQEEKDSPIPDIPKSHQFGSVKKTVIKKNKAKKVEVEVLDIKEEFGDIGDTQTINYVRYTEPDWYHPETETYFIYDDSKENEFYDKTELAYNVFRDKSYTVTKNLQFNLEGALSKSKDINQNFIRAEYCYRDKNTMPTGTTRNLSLNELKIMNNLPITEYSPIFATDYRMTENKIVANIYALNDYNLELNILYAKLTCRGIKRKTEKKTITYEQ